MYKDYASEQINRYVSFWAFMKKEKNIMFLPVNQETTVKLRDNTMDLKEIKDLFGRLLVFAMLNRYINQKEAMGNYEFISDTKSHPDGTILPCTDKSKFIHFLEKLARADMPH